MVCMRAAAVSGRRMGDVGMLRASCMQQSGSYGREVHSRDPAPEQGHRGGGQSRPGTEGNGRRPQDGEVHGSQPWCAVTPPRMHAAVVRQAAARRGWGGGGGRTLGAGDCTGLGPCLGDQLDHDGGLAKGPGLGVATGAVVRERLGAGFGVGCGQGSRDRGGISGGVRAARRLAGVAVRLALGLRACKRLHPRWMSAAWLAPRKRPSGCAGAAPLPRPGCGAARRHVWCRESRVFPPHSIGQIRRPRAQRLGGRRPHDPQGRRHAGVQLAAVRERGRVHDTWGRGRTWA